MRILVALWTVCLVGLCHCGNEIDGTDGNKNSAVDGRNEGRGQKSLRNTQGQSQPENIPLQTTPVNAKPTTLNIKSPDKNTIEKYNPKLHSLETPIYTAKNGYYIEKIMEGNVEICKGLPAGAFVKVTHCHRDKWFDILHVYIVESDDKKDVKYFLKKDNKWSPIKEEDFYDHFNALSHTEHAFKEKEFRLDKKQTDWKIYINESPKSPFKVYAARSNRRVKEVKDGSTSIWKRQKDEWCTKITLYPKTGDYKLMWIVTKDPYEKEEILYYSKNGTTWTSVNKDAYLEDLKKAGFNESTFNDRVTLDISKYDKDLFFEDKYNVDIVTMNRYHVLPGFRINKVVDGDSLIWESKEDDKFATYFRLNTRGSKVSLGALFTTNTKKEHKILYYKKVGDEWTLIDKSLYYDILAGRNSPIYTHDVKPKMVMSSFRNKKDLKVMSYAFTIENAKADIILVHGTKGSVITDFGTFDMDWSYERFGFDIFPHCSIFDEPVEDVKKVSNVDRYRQYFEYKTLEGMNPYDILHRSQYEGTFLEALNRLGYNIYGMDLQSHGFSEGINPAKRAHAKSYGDYAHDLMQFLSIIKRGKFYDTSQKWDEQLAYGNHPTDKKVFLFGYSIGGNIVIRAIQKFYKHGKNKQARIADGVLLSSCMLDVEHYLDTRTKKFVRWFLNGWTWAFGSRDCPYQYPYDVEIAFDRFTDYNSDMLYYNRIPSMTTIMGNFRTTRKARNVDYVKYVPSDLPLFLAHTVDDDVCDVKGPHTFISRLEDSKSVKLVEFTGSGHYSVATHLVPILIPHLNAWLDERFYGGAKYLPPKLIKVSLTNRVDESVFATEEGMEKGVPVLRLKVKPGKSATKLVYMGRTIWSSSSCSSCCISACCVSVGCASSLSSATLYFNGTVLELVKVTVGDTEKLLHRTRSTCCNRTSIKWVENETKFNARLKWLEEASNLDTFLPKLEEMNGNDVPTPEETLSLPEHTSQLNEPSSPKLSSQEEPSQPGSATTPTTKELLDIRLDITDVDLRVVTMSESFMDGMLVKKTFTPNDGFRLMEVLDMNLPIWTSSDPKEHAKTVMLYYNGDTLVSVIVNIVKAGGKSPWRYYMRQDGSWSQVRKADYEASLKSLKENKE